MTDRSPAPPKMTAIDGGVEEGITWATCRAPMFGATNGYVRIPPTHPWFRLDYDEIHEAEPDLAVNGGLTFSRDGWIGFDTLHAGDYWPGSDLSHFCRDGECDCINWTDELVAAETRRLARQVAEVLVRYA